MIRIVCPTCAARLEVPYETLGELVECSSCAQVFSARLPTSARPDTSVDDYEKRGRGYRNSSDDPDDDVLETDVPIRRFRKRNDGSDAFAVVALVFATLSLGVSFCPCLLVIGVPLSLLGFVFGGLAFNNPRTRGTATVALVISTIASCIWLAWMMLGFFPGWFNLNKPNDPNAPWMDRNNPQPQDAPWRP